MSLSAPNIGGVTLILHVLLSGLSRFRKLGIRIFHAVKDRINLVSNNIYK